MRRREYEKKKAAGNASGLSVGIVVSRFNEDITESMLDGARSTLRMWKVREKDIHVVRVYGSFEVPFACARLIKRKKLDAVIAIGCIVKGETRHDEYLARATTDGLMRVMLDYNVPVGFGIITTNDLKQAHARSRGVGNKGSEAAAAALEAALM